MYSVMPNFYIRNFYDILKLIRNLFINFYNEKVSICKDMCCHVKFERPRDVLKLPMSYVCTYKNIL